MVLVLFLLGIFLFLSLLVFLLLLSSIKIEVKKLRLDNTKGKGEKIEKELLVYIGFYLFGLVKLFHIRIDQNRLKKWKVKNKLEKIDVKQVKKEIEKNGSILEMIKKLQIDFITFGLEIHLGTLDVLLTTILNFIVIMGISLLLPKVIKRYDSNHYHYEVEPIYANENMVKLDFHCIIQVKMVHIMDILYEVLKIRRVKKHGRTSNRRSYDYSYE